jgi:dTDP-4-amino-4,6-dideoxygalactose transaminase
MTDMQAALGASQMTRLDVNEEGQDRVVAALRAALQA